MPISPEYLPSELHYIIPFAELHGSDARVVPYDRRLGRHVPYGEKLTPEEIEPLRKLYSAIRANGHCQLINDWYHDHSGKGTCPPETSFPVYGLLCLFDQLAKLGVAPFDDGEVGTRERQETLDWSKLPTELSYLAAPAEKYGAFQFEGRIIEFLREQMTTQEQAELRALNQRYEQDGEAIDRWLDEFPMTSHPEAGLVYFTGHLLWIGADLGLL